jgi:hypothetical protein
MNVRAQVEKHNSGHKPLDDFTDCGIPSLHLEWLRETMATFTHGNHFWQLYVQNMTENLCTEISSLNKLQWITLPWAERDQTRTYKPYCVSMQGSRSQEPQICHPTSSGERYLISITWLELRTDLSMNYRSKPQPLPGIVTCGHPTQCQSHHQFLPHGPQTH